jgi:hypothetical protein
MTNATQKLLLNYTLLLTIILSFSFISIDHSPKSYTHCSIKNTAFKAGEKLTHKAYYNWNFVWIGAGETISRVSEKGKQYQFDVTGRTYSSYEWFYRIRDYYEARVDKSSLLPSVSLRNIKEGGFSLYDKVYLDQNNRKAKSIRGKTKEKTREKIYDIDACVHDIVSMIYFFRNVNYRQYKKGKEFPMKIFMDREVWNLKLKYEGKKVIHVRDKGKYKAIQLTCRVSAGELFDENSSVTIWVSDDGNRVPLQAKLELAIGSIKIVLKDYKGLKYPLKKWKKK